MTRLVHITDVLTLIKDDGKKKKKDDGNILTTWSLVAHKFRDTLNSFEVCI